MKPTTKATRQPAKRKASHTPEPVPAAPVAPIVPAPISVTLSPEASELVRWYMETVGHRAGDTVDGAVVAMLESAKAAYDCRPRGDEGFDSLLRATLESRDRTADTLSWRTTRRTTVELDDKATTLLRLDCRETGQDVRDMVSAAVVFMLAQGGGEPNDEHCDSGVALEAAKARRLASEREEAA